MTYHHIPHAVEAAFAAVPRAEWAGAELTIAVRIAEALAPPPRAASWSGAECAAIFARYVAGESYAHIGAPLGLSARAVEARVSDWRRAHGIPAPFGTGGRPRHETR